MRLLASICFVFWLPAFSALAQAFNPTNSPGLQVSIRNEECMGNNDWQVQRAYLQAGTNRMAFLVPRDFRADGSDSRRIDITDNQCSCFISVRLIATEGAPAKQLEADDWRGMALNHFPGSIVVNEFTDLECLRSGPAFDLQWSISDGAEQMARIVFIPTSAGVLEFSVLSKASGFESGQSLLRTLMLSLRTNEDGPLKVSQVFDRT